MVRRWQFSYQLSVISYQLSGDRRLVLFILPTSPLPHFPTSPLPHFPKKIKSARFQENISLPPSARVSIVGCYARKLLSNLGRISSRVVHFQFHRPEHHQS
ncbi:MAG: hypothetical protein EWV49_08295 [Microcystis aeruginosa Ma_QC_Ch_20071001_S25]|uniref:Uncharacterized protein n=1 Tax=Microcystis aeruginosa Ma_QC_Ch_20071001_S25D TaxID=2486250 RepID=A0A552FDP3_MICAE|nr:MAG: hypothetical protein EWV57_21790 [Microcystis aeruginosa Ma_QC_Ch_20071001_S25D]TRU50921.1 MAG: hypothetical protein EWV49_08295 [Microcystis aeruginosa Ma_QC_Ch_20071001_S25]TRU63114.1 MAG: hypothetical protein EWV90_09385 [Microcystis aeruginosa Ma_QC_Ch_20071001_M135]